eukprot:869886-Alexandrium_andersonii.AAC.1
MRSAPLFALIQNLATKGADLGLPGRRLRSSWGRSGGSLGALKRTVSLRTQLGTLDSHAECRLSLIHI